MGMIPTAHTLTWSLELSESAVTTAVLRDGNRRRWGWVVNAAAADRWTAHVGSWSDDRIHDAIDEVLETFDSLAAAKDWVETTLAAQWADRAR